jgi:O-antigen ligase
MESTGTNTIQRFGFRLLLVFLFIAWSRLFELVLAYVSKLFGVSPELVTSYLRIPALLSVLTVAAAAFCGGLFRAFSPLIGRLLLTFTAWLVVALPFSVWKGGSFFLVVHVWMKCLALYLAIAGLIRTIEQCHCAIRVIGYATFSLALAALLFGNTETGRLSLPLVKFENPNDLALALVIGLPFVCFTFLTSPPTIPHRMLPAILLIVVLTALTRTGSRSGFIGFVAVLLVLFFRAPLTGKLAVAFAALLITILSALTLPEELQRRYFTLFEDVSPDDDEGEIRAPDDLKTRAVAAAESRYALLALSLQMTIDHPLLGAGPGMFAVAQAYDAKEAGERARWQETHNAYTQVSSEAGLPALFCYLAAMFCCFRESGRVKQKCEARPDGRWKTAARAAAFLNISLVAFAATAFFSSVAYQALFPILAGLIVAHSQAVNSALAAEPVPEAVAA